MQPFTPTALSRGCQGGSIQKQPTFGILHNPPQPLLQVRASHGAACHDGPFVRLDGVQPESLHHVIGLTTGLLSLTTPRTCRTSSSLMAPETSRLFLNTSKLAPVSRWHRQSSVVIMLGGVVLAATSTACVASRR